MNTNAAKPRITLAMSLVAVTAFTLATGASAQELASMDGAETAPEVIRDARDLADMLRPHPDPDSVDTALVFTNPRGVPTLVVCTGRNSEGAGVGRARTEVPAYGVRLIFASDLSSGRDFVGSATCKSRARVVPSAFVVGADLSDAPVDISHGWGDARINFPIIATF